MSCSRACPPYSPLLRHRPLRSRPLLTGHPGPINSSVPCHQLLNTRGHSDHLLRDSSADDTPTHRTPPLTPTQSPSSSYRTRHTNTRHSHRPSLIVSPMALLTRDSPVFSTQKKTPTDTRPSLTKSPMGLLTEVQAANSLDCCRTNQSFSQSEGMNQPPRQTCFTVKMTRKTNKGTDILN